MSEEVTIGEAVRARLLGQSDVTDLVGTRVYPLTMPSSVTLPAISYQDVGEARPRAMVRDPEELVSVRMQLNCWAEGYLSSRRLAREVIDALEDYSGVSAGMTIQSIEIVNQMDQYEPDAGGIYRTIVEVKVWHHE